MNDHFLKYYRECSCDGTPSNADNNFDKTIGEDGGGMSASDFVIKGDGEIIFVSAYKPDNEIKSVI